jgi:tungstate transport system substrate-binding protein
MRASAAAVCAALLVIACGGLKTPYLALATTTSVSNSGLLDVLLPAWRQTGGAEVRPTLAGSGRALRMLELRQADVVISHAPEAETIYLARHPDWRYRKIMFNEFVIVGPAADEARLRTATTLDEALRRLASGAARFVSRGDYSGTHEREQALWKMVDASPGKDRIVTSGAGMAVTLRQASELDAYTLTDRATFEQLKESINSVLLWSGDPRLLNTYAAIVDPHAPRAVEAIRFVTWLEDGEGRGQIEAYRIARSTVQPFRVWPAAAAREMPSAMPW